MGTSIDKLNYMSTTKTKIKDAINLTNVNITTDTFRSYETKFKQGIINTLNDPDAVWNNFTKVTGTGESLTLTPTEHAPMVLTLKGQTTQASTPTPSSPQQVHVVSGDNTIKVCGKNLIPTSDTISTSGTTSNGVTFTRNSDGSIKANGTATSAISIYLNNDYTELPTGTYKFSDSVPSGESGTTFFLYADVRHINGTSWDTYNFQSIGVNTQTIPEGFKFKTRIVVRNGQTLNDVVFKPMLEKNNQATTYEPYTGNTYEINLGLKNLFDISTSQSYKWLTYQGAIQNSSDPNIVSAFIKVENGKQYIFSGIPTGTYSVRACSYTGTTTNTFKTLLINNSSNIRTFTADADYIVFAIGQADATALTNIQLTKGSTPQRVSDNPIELCKIGTYQDYIRKSSGKNLYPNVIEYENKVLANNGAINDANNFVISYEIEIDNAKNYYLSWAIGTLSDKTMRVGYYDSTHTFISRPFSETTPYNLVVPSNAKYIRLSYAVQNFSNIQLEEGQATSYEPYGNVWYLHKEIGKVVLNGSETFGYNDSGVTGIKMITFYRSDLANKSGNYLEGLSNYFTNKMTGKEANTIRFGANNTNIYFYINASDYASANDFKTWLSTHNTSIYYVLATPTNTQIEDSELLEQLNSIKSCDGVTNISQSSSDKVSILDATAIKEVG